MVLKLFLHGVFSKCQLEQIASFTSSSLTSFQPRYQQYSTIKQGDCYFTVSLLLCIMYCVCTVCVYLLCGSQQWVGRWGNHTPHLNLESRFTGSSWWGRAVHDWSCTIALHTHTHTHTHKHTHTRLILFAHLILVQLVLAENNRFYYFSIICVTLCFRTSRFVNFNSSKDKIVEWAAFPLGRQSVKDAGRTIGAAGPEG